jgi:O-antigen/teichoic acid export membrane protein
MRVPLLSRIFVIVHAIIALVIFVDVWLSAGGYQNGLQWGVVIVLDYPVFFPWRYLPEGQSAFNPALIPELTLNWITLGYALLFGTIYWCALGWGITRLYRRFKPASAPSLPPAA